MEDTVKTSAKNPYSGHTNKELLKDALAIVLSITNYVPLGAFEKSELAYRSLQSGGYFTRIVDPVKYDELVKMIESIEDTEMSPLTDQDLETDEGKANEIIDANVVSAGKLRGFVYKLMAESHEHVIEIEVPDEHEKSGKISRALISVKCGIDDSMAIVSKLGKFLLGL